MMHVADVMTPKPVTVDQDKTLRQALELMEAVHCHHLPVTGSDGHLVGILTERDCRSALNAPTLLRELWETDALAE
jgi:CBS domain-containing protein